MIFRVLRKFGTILSMHQKKRIVQLVVLMIFGGFLETFSISIVLPFMNLIMNPDEMMSKWYIIDLCGLLGIQSAKTFLFVLAAAIAVLYIWKNIYLMIQYHIQYRFVYENMFSMQKRLLDSFIHRPYEYYLGANSGEIIRIINTDTVNTFNLLVTCLLLFTELIVSVMLAAAIFMITPLVTVCILVLLLFLLMMIVTFIRPCLRQEGMNLQKAAAGMNMWLMQSIQGIKEIKVMQKEKFFCRNYERNGKVYVRSLRRNQTFGILPRFVIEGVCMGSMFMMAAVLVFLDISLEALIPALTAVAMAAVRLLPSVNRISSSLAQIAYNEPMLDKMIENLNLINKSDQQEQSAAEKNEPAEEKFRADSYGRICFEHISYHYPDSDDWIFKDAVLEIHQGESIGIAGASGAGKTTLADVILGLLIPQKGRILIDGEDIQDDMEKWLGQTGYIPQMIFMLDDTIKANVAFGEEEIQDERVWEALKEAALDEYVRSLPQGLDTNIGERGVRISGGQRQRIGIARALYFNPKILILDEATSALDHEIGRAHV